MPRPGWAQASHISHRHVELGDTAVHHSWTSPTQASVWSGGEVGPVTVEIVQSDLLKPTAAGIVVRPRNTIIHLAWIGAEIPDSAEGRKLAAALLRCFDRLDGAGQ
ncbi:hypothetical protein GCM10028783_22930 [Modestobacter muralis]